MSGSNAFDCQHFGVALGELLKVVYALDEHTVDCLCSFATGGGSVGKEGLRAELDGLLVIWWKLTGASSSAEVFVDPPPDHVAQERCRSANKSMAIVHAAIKQLQLLLPHFHRRGCTLVRRPCGSSIQVHTLEGALATPHEAAQPVRGVLHSYQKLLQVHQHGSHRTVGYLRTSSAELPRDVRVRLIYQHVLSGDGTLLTNRDTERPKGANETMSVDTTPDGVGTQSCKPYP